MFEKEISVMNASKEEWLDMVSEHKYDFESGNPAVYVGTYHKYNCGSLYGMWVDLTTFWDYDEFMDFCAMLHSDEEDPEFMFQDYENFPSDFYSESDLNEYTFEKIQEYGNLDEDDKEMYDAFTEYYCTRYTIDEIKERCQGKFDSEREFAEYLFDEVGYEMPDFARRYFDYDAYADDLFRFDYTFVNGYVFSDY